LAGGFRESTGQYGNTVPLSGGWLTDVLDPNGGACGDVMLRLTVALNANEVAYCEGKEDGRPYRDRAYILAKNEYKIGTT